MQLPETTYFHKRIPKQKFYDNLSVSSELKREFIDRIRIIYWQNKIATSTTNLAAGETVTEIELFVVHLNSKEIPEHALQQIDREIPYHILFLLEHEDQWQAWVAYKEQSGSGSNAFKIIGYYHTEWMKEDALPLRLEGLNLDQAYENFVRQIAGNALQRDHNGESLKESIDRETRRKTLEKQISLLQSKVRKERQLNKQVQLNAELKALKKELEAL